MEIEEEEVVKEVEEEEGYRMEREEVGAIKLRGSRSQRRAARKRKSSRGQELMSRERSGHLRGCSGHSEVIEGSTTPPDYHPWEISMTTFSFLRSRKSNKLVSDKRRKP